MHGAILQWLNTLQNMTVPDSHDHPDHDTEGSPTEFKQHFDLQYNLGLTIILCRNIFHPDILYRITFQNGNLR